MRAVVVEAFGAPPALREVPAPAAPPGGVVLDVHASGLCRSDWHGWRGHDPDIRLPHVPGHEFAGTIAEVGAGVTGWRAGDRVTAPFVCACGTCPSCRAGEQQVCERQEQPGFTHWGSFADRVVVHHAAVNLVAVPDGIPMPVAAVLGCRFATAYRAVVHRARVAAGEWVAVVGCGGAGASAVMIAAAAGARVVAVDVSAEARELARRCGAAVTTGDAAEVRELTGGAHVSIDAVGSAGTLDAALRSLRRGGRHVQVGLLPAATGRPAVPMDLVIAGELVVLGSHGMAAHAYPEMLGLIEAGTLRPGELVTGSVGLDGAAAALTAMDGPVPPGVRVVVPELRA